MTCLNSFRTKCIMLMTIAVLCGCSTRTYITATGSTPPQYTHVYMTVAEVWLNSSAVAQPSDSGWTRFTLSEPVTMDLVSISNGTLIRLIGALRLSPGTYSQVRLIPVPATAALTDSAKALGAAYNNEVDYVDAGSNSHQLQLEILNPDNGIGAQGSLTVPVGGGLVASSPAATSSSTTSTGTTGGLSTNSNSTIVNFTINFNAATDIALFSYGSQAGVVLNSHAQAFDLSKCGGISGTLTLTNLSNITNKSARMNIVATAETPNADGASRHAVVISAPVNTDGTFLLYPLPANDSTKNPTTYDVVIHGAGIETIIIKGVQVARNSTSTTNTSSALMTGTATTSIGTLIPQAATSYAVNLATGVALPAGAVISLYQTLPGSGEVPYVVEQSTMDPFNNVMQMDLIASTDVVQTGLYTTTGQAITLTNTTPVEGAGTYTVAASAAYFIDGDLTPKVSASTSSTAALVTPTTLSVAAGASNDSFTAQVSHSSAGFDKGELIVSRDGTIIATAALDATLAASTGGPVTVNNLPGGSTTSPYATGVYDVSVLVWNSQDPAGTLQRQYFSAAADVRNGNANGVQIAIN